MEKAVDSDPYWERTGEGRWTALDGAIHETPEALIRAYVMSRGVKIADDLPDDLKPYVDDYLREFG